MTTSKESINSPIALPLRYGAGPMMATLLPKRNFLNILEGGCKAPIAAFAKIENKKIIFKSGLFSLDGSVAYIENQEIDLYNSKDCGINAAKIILKKGGKKLIEKIKNELEK